MTVERNKLRDSEPETQQINVPQAFYEGRDPKHYSDVAEQNRASRNPDTTRINDAVQEVIARTSSNPIDDEERKKTLMERARTICLTSEITNRQAWEQMKLLLLAEFPELDLSEKDPMDTSVAARTASLIESYFDKHRNYLLQTTQFNHSRRSSKVSKETQKYQDALSNLKNVYYRDVWTSTQGYLASIRTTLSPNISDKKTIKLK